MKVILKETVPKLGAAGQVVEVADGYGRNYLIPRGLADVATPARLKAFQEEERQKARKRERARQEARELAARLAGMSVRLPVRAGAGGRLFGSVTAQNVAEALAAAGVEVDKRKVDLPEPIKQLGTVPVTLRLAPGVTAQIRLEVVGAEAAGAPPEAAESPEKPEGA